jgi:serine/threonine protein kinase
MGAVYEALDRETGQPVALKTLMHSTPASLYLFKQEFRTLADLSHPNLVRLHELVMTDPEHVFFAMELIRGTDLLEHVHKPGMLLSSGPPVPIPDAIESHTRVADGATLEARSQESGEVTAARRNAIRRPCPADLGRLRLALCQLVEGVMALHAAHKLHCDIKPSNVLVTPEGRIVLLDFGVATEFSHVVNEEMREEMSMVGTARYMAPEQAFEQPSPACDWYSVGVMLYEALVGHAPFAGSNVDVLTMKNTIDPLPPSLCVTGVPADLDALCVALLHREPAMRPNGSEILKRLARTQSIPARPLGLTPTSDIAEVRRHIQLAGREAHRRALEDAFDATLRGRSVTVRVGGRSGMGKSTLVHRFLDELVERGAAVVLRGRAYEREAVPYKAFDSVIDSLSRYLMCMSDEDLSVALPTDAWALARLFPVLRRVPGIGALPEQPITDPQRVRRRAFLALRELLSVLARRRPIVCFVDDAQWGDIDSAALWLELVRPPSAPPLLLLMTYRDEEAVTSPFLGELRAHWPETADVRDLSVGPLTQEDARHLAIALLGSDRESVKNVAAAIARESTGSPFLVEELAHSLSERGPSGRGNRVDFASVTLEQMVHHRVAALPAPARSLLEIVAVCGRPIASSVASRAVGLDGAADEVISLLRTNRFLRVGLRDGREVLEPVHARIGETVTSQLGSAAVKEHHARLARVLESMPEVDVEALATHLLGAGETARAAQFAERAAELAAGKLAFVEAARMLRVAIEAHEAASPDGSRLRKRLGEVLEWAGKSAEAGDVYLEAVDGAPAAEKGDLQRAAAEQLYLSGRMEEGTRVLYQVLAAVGRKAPGAWWSALFWLFAYHMWIRMVGLRFRERSAKEVSAQDRRRIEAMYAVTMGLANVDYMRCMSIRARILVDSLRCGDRGQVARAASVVALDLAGNGPETKTELALWHIARRLADKEQDPAAKMAVRVTTGVTSFMRGRWRKANEGLGPIVSMVTNRRFALQNAVLFALYANYFLGELKELAERYARFLADAEESGNVFMSAHLRLIAAAPVWLAADDPDRARRELEQAARWAEGRFSAHWRLTSFTAEVDLYVGDGARAYERVKGLWRALGKNFYRFVQYVRALTLNVQGRAAIASLEGLGPGPRRSRLAELRRLQRRLERERMPWTHALATILEAGWANAKGNRDAATAALRSAIERAGACDMALHAAAARHQLGVLLGGDEGAKHIREAEDAMTACGVRAPARFAAVLVPGRWEPANSRTTPLA